MFKSIALDPCSLRRKAGRYIVLRDRLGDVVDG
jgi:hypothetical protein